MTERERLDTLITALLDDAAERMYVTSLMMQDLGSYPQVN